MPDFSWHCVTEGFTWPGCGRCGPCRDDAARLFQAAREVLDGISDLADEVYYGGPILERRALLDSLRPLLRGSPPWKNSCCAVDHTGIDHARFLEIMESARGQIRPAQPCVWCGLTEDVHRASAFIHTFTPSATSGASRTLQVLREAARGATLCGLPTGAGACTFSPGHAGQCAVGP